MSEIEGAVKEAIHPGEWSLNSWIGGLVAVVATFMAIGNVKDGNIVQAMAQVQTRSVDAWSYYQAKSIKQHIAENMAEQMKTQVELAPAISLATRSLMERKVAQYEAEAGRYDKEKEEFKKQATGYEAEYERLNRTDDQFDMSQACLTVSIALLGVSSLIRKRWLFVFGCCMACAGTVFGLA